jgi:GrpB-like predicted nucleotidyltransferase (UPF0157 family)
MIISKFLIKNYMITPEQEKWLSHLNDNDSIKIYPADSKAGEKFEKIKKQIQSVLGEKINIVHKGATSLGISGQGELDVYIPVPPENFDSMIVSIEKIFGKAGSLYPLERARFITSVDDTKVELFVINEKRDGWINSCKFEKYLKENSGALEEYKKLKESGQGLSTQKYYRRKVEFINDILEKDKVSELVKILSKNNVVMDILKKAPTLEMKNWYLGAGCISQTVWNYKFGFDLNNGINDYDLVYFDESDTSYEAEDKYIQEGKKLFGDVPVEIRNQARVHLWYKSHFGGEIEPYESVEDAIRTWPTTSNAIGIRIDENENFKIFSPFGLSDLMGLIVRANKIKITEEIYMKKVDRWTKVWPNLVVVPW